ncbi:MAG: hypothetical protein JSS62_04030 [Verrucomicrobia bacterium]|nr:hypothetical protein [Verrucomicrobiota bacterium]MBS0647060.1 hypothetical protein [Verrucomicrobiota bacterium]
MITFIKKSIIQKHLLFVCLSATCHLQALPIFNPWEYALLSNPETCNPRNSFSYGSFRLGFLGDYVFNRKLEVNQGSFSDINQTSLRTYQGILSLNLCKRFEIYAGLGASQLSLHTPASSFNYQFAGTAQIVDASPGIFAVNNFPFFDPNSPLSLYSNSFFSCSAGLNGILWHCKNFALSASGRYFYTNPPINNIVLPPTMEVNTMISPMAAYGGTAPSIASSVIYPHSSIQYQEWQTDLCFAYAICISRTLKAIPFGAIEWSGALVNFGNVFITSLSKPPPVTGGFEPLFNLSFPFTAQLYDLAQQRLFGYTVGASFVGRDCFAASIEWRFVNENAFCVDLNVSF